MMTWVRRLLRCFTSLSNRTCSSHADAFLIRLQQNLGNALTTHVNRAQLCGSKTHPAVERANCSTSQFSVIVKQYLPMTSATHSVSSPISGHNINNTALSHDALLADTRQHPLASQHCSTQYHLLCPPHLPFSPYPA